MKPTEIIGNCNLYLGDCRELLAHLPKVDWVLTDPPSGIGIAANPVRQKHENWIGMLRRPALELSTTVLRLGKRQLFGAETTSAFLRLNVFWCGTRSSRMTFRWQWWKWRGPT
jgi:DNA modification methylase